MIKPKTRIAVPAAIVSMLFLAMATLYLCRGSLLQHVADRRIDRLEQRYKLDIAYDKLTMKGLSTVSLHGFTVVPEHRDTLLRLHSLEVRISLWKLLWGNIKVRNVQMDGLKLDFIKQDSTANYDFLFLPPHTAPSAEGAQPSGQEHMPTDYARHTHTILNLLFGLLPGDGNMTHLCINERKDSNFVTLRIPEFRIDKHHFHSAISITEDTLTQQWNTEGEINPSDRRLCVNVYAPRLTVPYIQRRFGAEVQFDSLKFSLFQEKASGKSNSLTGQSEVSGLQVHHKRLSPAPHQSRPRKAGLPSEHHPASHGTGQRQPGTLQQSDFPSLS